MKQWHIQTRILLTLVALTAAILLAVGLAFNLSVRGYIRSRVSAQLTNVTENAFDERKGALRGRKGIGEQRDRVTGATGNAVVLDADGNLVTTLRADAAVGEAIAAYFASHELSESGKYRTLALDDASYAITVSADPVQEGCYLVSFVDVTSILAFTARINLVLLVIIGAAILLSVFLSRRFARSFAEPVRALSDFAREIGGGNFENRDLRFRDLEFGQLAFSMNRMASALREANRKQETFFQNVSHELRTPLTAIRGNAEGFACGVMEPMDAARVILAESDKLGGMVEDILYLSRMGKATPDDSAEPLDLRDVLSLCVSEQRAEAERRGLSFRFDFDGAPVLLSIREQDAQRLFGNLISNAIRYAAHTITLTCRASADAVTVSVADDGAGVAPDDLPHVFERFYKGAGGKHGIGLSIAQSVAQAYHGTLTVRNDGGAVFEARFPV